MQGYGYGVLGEDFSWTPCQMDMSTWQWRLVEFSQLGSRPFPCVPDCRDEPAAPGCGGIALGAMVSSAAPHGLSVKSKEQIQGLSPNPGSSCGMLWWWFVDGRSHVCVPLLETNCKGKLFAMWHEETLY